MSLNPLSYGPHLRQPDQRSCGPSCLVVARMRLQPEYAAEVLPRFGGEVLETHRRVVGLRPAMGALQLPWPRALGTPPWAVAREMSRITGTSYSWRLARWGRMRAHRRILAGLAAELPVPVFVGNARLPRHVVLATDEDEDGAVVFYNPANGRLTTVPQEAITTGALGLGSWDVPWFTVTPRS